MLRFLGIIILLRAAEGNRKCETTQMVSENVLLRVVRKEFYTTKVLFPLKTAEPSHTGGYYTGIFLLCIYGYT